MNNWSTRSFIHSATHCLVTHVIHSCHCAPCMHESHAYHCLATLCMWRSDACMHITKRVTHSQQITPVIADWLSNSPSLSTAGASLSPQSTLTLTQSVNRGLSYSDSPLSTVHRSAHIVSRPCSYSPSTQQPPVPDLHPGKKQKPQHLGFPRGPPPWY